MLDVLNHQGRFATAYVRALAAAAGLLVYGYDLENDGIDLGLRLPGKGGGVASPGVEVQVRTWSRVSATPRGAEWHFAGLDEVNFNRLAGADFTVPRFLVMVRTPPESGGYVTFETEGMLLRHLAYYHSLRDEPLIETPDPRRRRTLRVPTSNVLTAQSLLNLIHPVELLARSTA
ncbi:DUF4365 domain-containing protein [Amycolatopsis sp. H20-H5]|uniref:DUF4365 domain-containing protein n=1 Tax=Amycolatopsis sp. H20-H5 TaxID=3046309 RepID=UPI002DBC2D9D|nr:DUF4365 domain-containing protein [Amycolatopsis sp. H20-H5]MEC3974101.1 DUF4365 domain-containing protein [Amycolatopsis sp. H20-H5]